MMELTLLTVPGCPNAALFEERLAAALAGHPDTVGVCAVIGESSFTGGPGPFARLPHPSGPVACYAKPSSRQECQGSRR